MSRPAERATPALRNDFAALRHDFPALQQLVHGKPLLFGKDGKKGIRLGPGYKPEVVTVGQDGITEADILVHDETSEEPSWGFLLSRLRHPEFPEPIGVFRAVQGPTYNELVDEQITKAVAKQGRPSLQQLLTGNDTWVVE